MTVFITGPGRSGTSFLVQLFTRLGFDTGYEPYLDEGYNPAIRAGCEAGPSTEIALSSPDEIRSAFDKAPRIIKGPAWAYLLKHFHKNNLVEIEHVFMPIRDLTDSAYSRLDVGLDFLMDKDFICVPGVSAEEIQENVLAMLVGKVLEVCYIYQIPLTLMRFPKLVTDEEYCYRKVVDLEEIDRNDFGEVYRQLANPSQIKWSNSEVVGKKVRHPA